MALLEQRRREEAALQEAAEEGVGERGGQPLERPPLHPPLLDGVAAPAGGFDAEAQEPALDLLHVDPSGGSTLSIGPIRYLRKSESDRKLAQSVKANTLRIVITNDIDTKVG